MKVIRPGWRLLRGYREYEVRRGLLFGLIGSVAVVASLAVSPGPTGFLGAGLGLVTLSIAAVDGRMFVIPDWLNAVGLLLGLANAAAYEPSAMTAAVFTASTRAAALALSFLVLRYSYACIRGREGIGLGDVKLAAVAGAWLDWLFMPVCIELAALAALAAYGLRQLHLGRRLSATNRVPFGFFFAPAIWVTWLLQAVFPLPF